MANLRAPAGLLTVPALRGVFWRVSKFHLLPAENPQTTAPLDVSSPAASALELHASETHETQDWSFSTDRTIGSIQNLPVCKYHVLSYHRARAQQYIVAAESNSPFLIISCRTLLHHLQDIIVTFVRKVKSSRLDEVLEKTEESALQDEIPMLFALAPHGSLPTLTGGENFSSGA